MEVLPTKTIVLEMSSIERMIPKPPAPELPPEVAKKVEPIKPIEKPKPLPKPVVKKEVVNPEPIKEVATPVETVAQPHEVVTPPKEVVPPAPAPHVEAYEKTDFEIIRDKVLSRLIYPSAAKRMGYMGIVQIALEIDTSGHLVVARIHQSSGKTVLDEAALEAANKLKGELLPKPKSTSVVILPIAFKLR